MSSLLATTPQPFTADISAGFPDYQYNEENKCQSWLSDHCDNVCMNAQTETINQVPASCQSITNMTCQFNSDNTYHQICSGTYVAYSPPPPPSYPSCPSDEGMFWATDSPGNCQEKCGVLCSMECGEGGGWCAGPPTACYMSKTLGCWCGTLSCVAADAKAKPKMK